MNEQQIAKNIEANIQHDLNPVAWDVIKQKGMDILMDYGHKLIFALILLFVGWKAIGLLKKGLRKIFEKREVDISLRPFILTTTSIGLKVLLILSVINIIGIPMTSFVALIGAAGLAIGMAFSGTLSNVAGGVIILVIRPFKVGDYIAAQSYEGTVKSILIFNTILTTVDNKTVILPNGALATGNIINYSTMQDRRLDVNIKLARGVDIIPIQNELLEIAKQDSRIFKDPLPVVIVTINETSVNLNLRFWVKNDDYWDINADMHKNIYLYLSANNIDIPYQKINFIPNN